MVNGKMNKRGINSIVTLALILLGTVIGVALLWNFVLKNTDRSDEIDQDCFTLDLDIVECRAYGLCGYGSGLGSYEADILVNRGIGPGNISGLRFIFESPSGFKGVYDRKFGSQPLNELTGLRFQKPNAIPVIGAPNIVRLAAIFGDNRVCPIASRAKYCEVIHGPPLTGAIPNTTYVTPGAYFPNPYGGNCCQFPHNYSECYNGLDINFPVNPTGQLVNGIMPIGNRTLCCAYDPNSGLPPAPF